MPRHLDIALDRWVELAPTIARVEHPSAEYLHQQVSSAAPVIATLTAYREGWFHWARLGFELSPEVRRRVRALWSEYPHLRFLLEALVLYYPCDEFEGAFCRSVEHRLVGDFIGWFRWAPRLHAQLRASVVERARKFNEVWTAEAACLAWARYFDGGDEAYRAFALALNRNDRVHAKTHKHTYSEDFVRHDLEQHGVVTAYEAAAINRHLEALGGQPIDLRWIGTSYPAETPSPEIWRRPHCDRKVFSRMVEAARTLAGDAWSTEDDELYARARLRLE